MLGGLHRGKQGLVLHLLCIPLRSRQRLWAVSCPSARRSPILFSSVMSALGRRALGSWVWTLGAGSGWVRLFQCVLGWGRRGLGGALSCCLSAAATVVSLEALGLLPTAEEPRVTHSSG